MWESFLSQRQTHCDSKIMSVWRVSETRTQIIYLNSTLCVPLPHFDTAVVANRGVCHTLLYTYCRKQITGVKSLVLQCLCHCCATGWGWGVQNKTGELVNMGRDKSLGNTRLRVTQLVLQNTERSVYPRSIYERVYIRFNCKVSSYEFSELMLHFYSSLFFCHYVGRCHEKN